MANLPILFCCWSIIGWILSNQETEARFSGHLSHPYGPKDYGRGSFEEVDVMPLGSGQTVLIVDDSPVMRQMLFNIFENEGFKVVAQAADGEEALSLFEIHKPDLTTLDIVMPKIRGTDVLATLMDKHPDSCIIMASSVSDARTVMHCLKMGARQYIIKPYDEQKVMAAVKKALVLG
ncbi:MAG: response regulator [Deltaproteobacteria bacterium]|nr:response regulator [Deltaproteobacteria bacterium]